MADMARLIWAEWADTNPNKPTRFITGDFFYTDPCFPKSRDFLQVYGGRILNSVDGLTLLKHHAYAFGTPFTEKYWATPYITITAR